MPGLVPGIHAEPPVGARHLRSGPTWMAGTSLDEPGHDDIGAAFSNGL
jgi:hypothetical protein